MGDILNIALSGAQASSRQLSNAANNIVNADTTSEIGAPRGEQFIPQDIIQISQDTGGVQTDTRDRDPASQTSYAPNDPKANEQGLVERPAVDLSTELVKVKQAEQAYRASINLLTIDQDLNDVLTNAINTEA